jgi:arylsulfatase A-like enzyme
MPQSQSSSSLPHKRFVHYNRGMNAVCLVFDRLHAGYLGAYGNAWIETPALDRLAGRSLVLDRALVDSPHLERLYRSYWQGRHALFPATQESSPGLAALLREAGVSTALLTDEPQVSRHPLAADFDELVEIDPPWQPQNAGDIEQTHFARCSVQTIEWLEQAREPFLLWCHWGGLGTTWDAPLRFREAYREEGDPPLPTSAEVPERLLPADYDPDERLVIAQSYAGQVALLDACLGAMLEFFDGQAASRETLFVLVSARGFPLGEHRRVGACDDALYGELVGVPCMIRFPDGAGAALRSQALVEPSDLWATLLDWWHVSGPPPSPTAKSLMPIVGGQSAALRDRLCLAAGAERAIRTPAWHLRAGGGEPELFAKPDDRWEVNNVASRCPDVVEGLQEALKQYEQAISAGSVTSLPPLGDVLLSGLE